ncbi:polysaccharide pyruvyl transferase family protein [Mycobacterium sp. NAZ190054]|uniref:polysaccharide pyruvyl transferase family protein n=1 Tax=Mycobacterium sp. NAZ190054 TaxID=1747766 RepID=UPI0018D1FB70|nr:polysaccharide pyruvyl transferase family protein [Mycobacterium sp. NAZ190054]
MSMQRIHNYGSTLQAYSLRRLIEEVVPGTQVSFRDYRKGSVLVHDASAPSSKFGRVISKLREYNAVDAPLRDRLRFFDHKRSYARRYFPAVGIEPTPNYDLNLDCQVIGSDEVFNCVQSNTNVGYSRDLFGHGTPARRLISYAASFGNTTYAKICSAGIEANISADLARFDALSVRDRNSREIINRLIGLEAQIHVDPALAYDLVNDKHVPSGRLHADPYIIVYGYSGRLASDENAALRDFARRAGAKILTFGGVQECGDAFVECSPFELLAYFRDALAIVTDTFHGTIFSIINHRPFGTIIRTSTAGSYGNEEKLSYLLESFGLASRRITSAQMIDDLLLTPVDDTAIDALLLTERRRSKKYLAENVIATTNQELP